MEGNDVLFENPSGKSESLHLIFGSFTRGHQDLSVLGREITSYQYAEGSNKVFDGRWCLVDSCMNTDR